tara:strand:+ start:323 stop:547 length:225 start_codon:yes stop_codon:yes gene_type:complete
MGGFVQRIVAPKPPPVAPQIQKEAVKSAPSGPTSVEIAQNQRRGIKRKGRRATILTSSSGVDEDLTLGTKTLLG